MRLTLNNRSNSIINPYILYYYFHYFQSHAQLITQEKERERISLSVERRNELANNLIYDNLSFEDVQMLRQIKL